MIGFSLFSTLHTRALPQRQTHHHMHHINDVRFFVYWLSQFDAITYIPYLQPAKITQISPSLMGWPYNVRLHSMDNCDWRAIVNHSFIWCAEFIVFDELAGRKILK